jgi:hypothetical protein
MTLIIKRTKATMTMLTVLMHRHMMTITALTIVVENILMLTAGSMQQHLVCYIIHTYSSLYACLCCALTCAGHISEVCNSRCSWLRHCLMCLAILRLALVDMNQHGQLAHVTHFVLAMFACVFLAYWQTAMYPSNVTLGNLYYFWFAPTLTYQVKHYCWIFIMLTTIVVLQYKYSPTVSLFMHSYAM